MCKKKIFDVIGTIMLFIGFFLAFLPHAVHVSAGLEDGTSHLNHVIIGIILVIIALVILIYNNNALKIGKRVKTFKLKR